MLDKFVRNTVREVSIDYIQKVVCDYFDIPIDVMKSKTRKRDCSVQTTFNVLC